MDELRRFKVWFDHRQGPYSAIHWGVDHEHVDKVWQASPFYIGSQAPGETPPGVVAEWFRYHGKPVPFNDEHDPAGYTIPGPQPVDLDHDRDGNPIGGEDDLDWEWDRFVQGDEEPDDREDDALYHSRDEMPAYQSNDLDWELAQAERRWNEGNRPEPEHDNDDRREAYYQAGLFPPSFLY
jgi:hypothetical protein